MDYLYSIGRILIGLLFFLHGAQKLFGWFGGIGMNLPAFSLFWFAGIIELLVGAGITVGLFTRVAAAGGAVEMVIAYSMAHFPKGIIPLTNSGEPAILYLAAFLLILSQGAKKLSLSKLLFKR